MTVGELRQILERLDPELEVKMERTGEPAVYVAGVVASVPWVKFVQCDHPCITLAERP